MHMLHEASMIDKSWACTGPAIPRQQPSMVTRASQVQSTACTRRPTHLLDHPQCGNNHTLV
eukprot:15485742-Alexandrium_andersonii.AAC.1